ncbi:hypothetical protein [Vibrio hippocampi]|nr:hypothetical protein [Vibrio hippocampi]
MLVLSITSIAITHANANNSKPSQLSASQFVSYLAKKQPLNESDAQRYLSAAFNDGKLNEQLNRTYLKDKALTGYLLLRAAKGISAEYTLDVGLKRGYDLSTMLELAYLTTQDKSQLTNNLLFTLHIDHDLIQDTAIQYGVDKDVVNKMASKHPADYRITPLFESVSISVFNRLESDHGIVEYRPLDAQQWLPASDLQWNSIENAHTTSIVYLKPETEYQLRVTFTVNNQPESPQEYAFKTWNVLPTFDPNKIFHLKDIYSGGQLDLEALNIKGKPNAWVKIIGDNTTPIVVVDDEYDSAINIGANGYIYFENIVVKGGKLNAISSDKSHHLWFNHCDVSQYGRIPKVIKNGKRYEKENDKWPVNYDSAFGLRRTGRVVIENCSVHSPNMAANSWESGHPHGANAYLAMANHPNRDFQGQIVLRNNRFFGTHNHRFNDVIESRFNAYASGGFVRDSAIYNNYLAYANDDLIELDGGQNNVLFYNNELEQGYVGVSIIPNRNGPSYIFNNYIHNLGDERGEMWAAIKAGGLLSRPKGVSTIYNNLILTNANGIGAAGFEQDYTFWVNAINNVMIHNQHWNVRGYSIYEKSPYKASVYKNNYMFNLVAKKPVYQANGVEPFYDQSLLNLDYAKKLWDSNTRSVSLNIPAQYRLPNLTHENAEGEVVIGKLTDE